MVKKLHTQIPHESRILLSEGQGHNALITENGKVE